MKLAVTGAGGLIGANIVRVALARGHEAVALRRPGGTREALRGTEAVIVEADMLGASEAIVAACTGADAIVHCAATFAYGRDAHDLHRIAVDGTKAMLHAAKHAGVPRVVVTSSSVVFGYSEDRSIINESAGLADPAGQPAYVAAKIAQDLAALALAEKLGITLVLACPTMSVGATCSALGPSNGLIVAYLADRTRSTFLGGCNIVSAEDVGHGHVILAERGSASQHYLLGSGNLHWRDIHALISDFTGTGGPYCELGSGLSWLAASFEEGRALLAGEMPMTTREQAGMIGRYYWYDSARAAALGYAPRPARAALLEAVSWLVGSHHVARETRATLRLSDEVWQHRFASRAA
ncbi:dihydroflavonol-4-reductase [Novosphingobium chloroacetimidivorans]|uniref:Dihydroflavonol-4-reductase n=1 Tax=Novosphingobium chloroacetimidivorans TaxID=1428314 RepID=A0A7W7KD76_9SPHN|nr:NAD-dependent epimerase/dehydratase family protein [Novosphingobium chloroacetimidivorans]MBB4860621.1 dihydroflavonol-4-reductase [Novosphingobium chloroacetimidivorans]